MRGASRNSFRALQRAVSEVPRVQASCRTPDSNVHVGRTLASRGTSLLLICLFPAGTDVVFVYMWPDACFQRVSRSPCVTPASFEDRCHMLGRVPFYPPPLLRAPSSRVHDLGAQDTDNVSDNSGTLVTNPERFHAGRFTQLRSAVLCHAVCPNMHWSHLWVMMQKSSSISRLPFVHACTQRLVVQSFFHGLMGVSLQRPCTDSAASRMVRVVDIRLSPWASDLQALTNSISTLAGVARAQLLCVLLTCRVLLCSAKVKSQRERTKYAWKTNQEIWHSDCGKDSGRLQTTPPINACGELEDATQHKLRIGCGKKAWSAQGFPTLEARPTRTFCSANLKHIRVWERD